MSDNFGDACRRSIGKKKAWLKDVWERRQEWKIEVIRMGWGKGTMGSREMHGVHGLVSKRKTDEQRVEASRCWEKELAEGDIRGHQELV